MVESYTFCSLSFRDVPLFSSQVCGKPCKSNRLHLDENSIKSFSMFYVNLTLIGDLKGVNGGYFPRVV